MPPVSTARAQLGHRVVLPFGIWVLACWWLWSDPDFSLDLYETPAPMLESEVIKRGLGGCSSSSHYLEDLHISFLPAGRVFITRKAVTLVDS